MNKKIIGKIDAIKQREKNWSIMVADDWFSALGQCNYSKGDLVDIEYDINGSFNKYHYLARCKI